MECGRSPASGKENGILVNSGCNFFSQVAYPSLVDLGLRVNQLGKTSATYEVGIFEKGSDDVKAVGGFTHVFCDMETFRPQQQGMCQEVRAGLGKLLVSDKPKL
ncbi:MAG: hypothetical protein MMC23_006873 [Stictis urceolatum]|nr:hypothetical protein [Stictis urceolata]